MSTINLPAIGVWYLTADTGTWENVNLGSGVILTGWTQSHKTFSGTPLNTTTGVFTAPSAGYYQVSAQVWLASSLDDGAAHYQMVLLHGSTGVVNCRRSYKGGDEIAATLQIFHILEMAASETLKIQLYVSGGDVDLADVIGGSGATNWTIQKLATHA